MRLAAAAAAAVLLVAAWWMWSGSDGDSSRSVRREAASRDVPETQPVTQDEQPPGAQKFESKTKPKRKRRIEVKVRLLDDRDRPLPKKLVRLSKASGKEAGRVLTDAEGVARFPDRYERLLIAHVGLHDHTLGIVRPRRQPDVTFRIKVRPLRIHVLGEMPETVGAIGLHDLEVNRVDRWISGRFFVDRPMITLAPPGYRSVSIDPGDRTEVEVEFVRMVKVRLDVAQYPWPVHLYRPDGTYLGDSSRPLELEPGPYVVRSPHLGTHLADVVVPLQDGVQQIVLRGLKPVTRIRVRKSNGTQQTWLRVEPLDGSELFQRKFETTRVLSSPQPLYAVNLSGLTYGMPTHIVLPDHPVRLSAHHPNYLTDARDVREFTPELEFELRPGVQLSFKYRGSMGTLCRLNVYAAGRREVVYRGSC
ncbi:MAG: hypothetical protein AAF488_16015, partial [Planctomycetota bacterium]